MKQSRSGPPTPPVLRALVGAPLPTGLRTAAPALWLLGAGIAGLTMVLAAARLGAGASLPYAAAAVAVALVVLAAATHRGHRWALITSLVQLGAQLPGVVGSAVELALGEAAGKAAVLRSLGIDPTLGVLANLAYSATAFGLFSWALIAFAARGAARHRRR
jgi:hypothetical protein